MRNYRHGMPKSPYMGVTNTVDYKCHKRGVITELILHKHTCINRKVGILDPPNKILYNVNNGLNP